jgi:hypothetical protein
MIPKGKREVIVWRRKAAKPAFVVNPLSAEEQANVRAALRFLRIRHGGMAKLASALGMKPKTLEHHASPKRPATAGLAIRLARAAQVPVEDIARGAWPPVGACASCGRCG